MYNFYESLDFSKEENHILDETDNFIVIPSIGSLVPGWLMVVPKRFYINSLSYPRDVYQEYVYILEKTRKIIFKKYATWTIFENGSVKKASIGCGVNYAHTHILPLEFNLIATVDENIGSYSSEHTSYHPFVYVKNMYSEKYFFVEDKESQFIRKIIAHNLQIDDKYDYSTYPFYENIDTTIKSLSHSF